MCEHHREVLDLERRFGRANPVAHLLRADGLVSLLFHFVERGVDMDDSRGWRLEFRLVEQLFGYLLDERLLPGRDVPLVRGLRRSLREARSRPL